MRRNETKVPELCQAEARRILPKRADATVPQPVHKQGRKQQQLEKTAALEQVTPMTGYYNYFIVIGKINQALAAFNTFIESMTVQASRYADKRERAQTSYIEKLKNLILASDHYLSKADEIDKEYQKVFSEANFKHIQGVLQSYIDALTNYNSPHSPEIIGKLQRYKQFLSKVSAAKGNFDGFKEDEVFEATEAVKDALLVIKVASTQEAQQKEIISEVDKIYELVGIKIQMPSDLESNLHNLENVLLEARLFLPIHPDQDSVNDNLNINKGIIRIQIRLLERLNTDQKAMINRGPVLNRDLPRVQNKKMPIFVYMVLEEKKKELVVFESLSAPKLVPLIDVINRTAKVNQSAVKEEGNLDDHLVTLTGLCDTDAFQNELTKAYVLTVMINCFTMKNFKDVRSVNDKGVRLKENIEFKIHYIQEFVDNLGLVKAAWNKDLFKFLNNFLFTKRQIEEVISGAEIAFLHCEVLFKSVDEVDLELKNNIIKMQIKLLEMQETLLHFAYNVYREEYIKSYYFKGAKKYEYIYYSAIARNQRLAESGNLHGVIDGIPFKEVEAYIKARKLKLEAIPLEYLAKQRTLTETGSDYEDAISGIALEEYLKKWEEEAVAEKALEEKHPAPPTKQKKLKKLAAKRADKAKAALKQKDGGKGEKPDRPVAKELVDQPESDPLNQTMVELMLKLNPKDFKPDQVKEVINKLHPIISNYENSKEQVFKALATIGDSYCMIAGHRLNRKAKKPQELIVNLELALNFYSRAKMELDKLCSLAKKELDELYSRGELVLAEQTKAAIKKYSDYYFWLQHSINVNLEILNLFLDTFTHQYERLLTSRAARMREMGDDWYHNSDKPGWKKSAKATQTEALRDALNARPESDQKVENALQFVRTPETQSVRRNTKDDRMQAAKKEVHTALSELQEKCSDLQKGISERFDANLALKMAFGFQHYLHNLGIRELENEPLNYKVQEPEAEVVEMVASTPDAEGVIDMVRVENQPQAVSQIAFTPLVDFNPYRNLHMDYTNIPVFMPLYPIFNEAHIIPNVLRQHLRYPAGQVSTAASATLPVVPFASTSANYPNHAATCQAAQPQQLQITYVPPSVTYEQQLQQSYNQSTNQDRAR